MAVRALVTSKPCKLLPYDSRAGVCARCGKPLTGAQRRWCGGECQRFYQDNHYWSFARPACAARFGNRCRKCGRPGSWADPIEINHKIPRNGRSMAAGCHHHQDNLEALCHPHHVEVTRHQRVSRARRKERRREEARRAQGNSG